MPTNIVNDKETIKIKSPPRFYHCYRLNQSNYALFDAKMDMPVVIGSLAIVKTIKLPPNSKVFYYEIRSKDGWFEKGADKYIEIKGDGNHTKPPLRYHNINPIKVIYHHFKLTTVLSAIFDDEFDMPIAYGSNQRIQAVINKINENSKIFYYKEDMTFKNSFKLFMKYDPKSA